MVRVQWSVGEHMNAESTQPIHFIPNVVLSEGADAGIFGNLGLPWPIRPDFGELLLKLCNEPEIVLKRYIKDDEKWELCEDRSISLYYPGGPQQTILAVVEDILDAGKVERDYYQVPYPEVPARLMMLLEFMKKQHDERWFVARINNKQLHGWMSGWGTMKQSDAVIEETESENQNIRDKYCHVMEHEEEQTDD